MIAAPQPSKPAPFDASAVPTVSVVMPAHGRPVELRRAIAAIASQDYPGVIETIVVHDKEEPDFSLTSNDPNRPVLVTRNTHTPGLPGARNAGIAIASGELIASHDDDDVWLPAKVARQVAALTERRDVLVVATGLILHTPDGAEHVRLAPKALISRADLLETRIPELHSSNLMMRRRALELAGPYDEDLVGVEDYDWLLRLSRHSQIAVVQEPLVHVYRDAPLWRPERWRRIAVARQQLIERHPELLSSPKGGALFCSKVAFANAAGGDRRMAARWLVRALRYRRISRWTLASAAVMAHVPARWIQSGAGTLGKSI